jgi:sulfur-oxidizing protein SoxZ
MNIVDKLVVRYGGREVFRAELGTGVAANPYIVFYAIADKSGPIEVEWSDDAGRRARLRRPSPSLDAVLKGEP